MCVEMHFPLKSKCVWQLFILKT